MDSHLENTCIKQILKCPFEQAGCEFEVIIYIYTYIYYYFNWII